ncbi:Crp/Fnr family transcriptional regulator [Leptospira noguchii]|uniref:Cyclic nucleotide-binding domain protein n=2 Tax=Leptospira noguchii TaxID=28182 RepID=T0FL14_9LEPT|nr:Crp/Fnr family transcriptional regulator [Leptospira noguchii]EMO55906.1 cyclic nucleotide-binding domain protein [Leptospira noguchii]EQA70804.1 cyclic nucleotide-binding domain protein [Leptospira noguchii serovar Panama str. CZ214]
MGIENEIPDCYFCPNRDKFKCISLDTLEKINSTKKFRLFRKNELLIQEGTKTNGFYFIKSGCVRIFRNSSSGKEQTFSIRRPGEWVGFRDLLAGKTFVQNVEAIENVEACFISKEVLNELMEEDSNFQMEILKQMATEWKQLEDQTLTLGTKQVHGKIAELLISFRTTSSDKSEIELNLTREIMASMVGTSTETLVRALSDFKHRKWIKIRKNRIGFLNVDALKEISGIKTTTYH